MSANAAASTSPRRVLVVDDSAFMRRLISEMINSDPDFTVAGTARDGIDALAQVATLAADIVTLDIAMPALDGLETLRRIMADAPRPVVVLSAGGTRNGHDVALRALELGAITFVQKPSGPISLDLATVRESLLSALRDAAAANVTPVRTGGAGALALSAAPRTLTAGVRGVRARNLVVIAASTGGPRALARLIPALPATLEAAVLVVQHLPAGFTRSLAEQLDRASALRVGQAAHGEPIHAGRVYFAPAGLHMRVAGVPGAAHIALDDAPLLWSVRPAADHLFSSAAASFGAAVAGVVLSGMGRDGANGLAAVSAAGGTPLVQDRASSVIYGMPQAALNAAAAAAVVPLDQLAQAVSDAIRFPAAARG